jgi:hypothetical protein
MKKQLGLILALTFFFGLNEMAHAQVTAPMVMSTPAANGPLVPAKDGDWTCETTCIGNRKHKGNGSKSMDSGEQLSCSAKGAHPAEGFDALKLVLAGKTKTPCECAPRDINNGICTSADGVSRSYSQMVHLLGNGPNGEKGGRVKVKKGEI